MTPGSGSGADDPRRARRASTVVVVAFWIAAGCAGGLAAVYALGGQPQIEGALLGGTFAGIGVGLITWGHVFLPKGPYEEPRPELATSEEVREATVEDVERGGVITRRRLILGSFAAAAGAMAAAAVFPIRSLGPNPGRALETTAWGRGVRLVTAEGEPVRADAVPIDGIVTVFPEGHPGSADGQAILIRVPRDLMRMPAGRAAWAPEGYVVYSKVCTHAGCPVGLFQATDHTLLCPCHQSTFDVLDGAKVLFGPAARALPQLPIEIGGDGVLRALGDFPEPIGPAYWFRP